VIHKTAASIQHGANVQNHLRYGSAQFKLCAHLLRARGKRGDLLLLARELGIKNLLLLSDR
jgi:hypothetical protein